jgi:uncharacterized membrane protein
LKLGCGLLAVVFVAAGALHFVFTPVYAAIVPPTLPAATLLVQISGAAEILGGIGVLIPATRRFAAWGLVMLLIAVWPANIYMAMDHGMWGVPAWVLWARVPLQVPLVWWAGIYTRR